ncbi:MAG: protein kinase [Betaproteobacteria bacterium]|nr:protein kinase [Betaproteobacteria bacterium]
MSESLPDRIGKYPVVRALGSGATSRVYLAEDPFTGLNVAIKVIKGELIADREMRRRIHRAYLNEAALAGKLIHPHIVAIYDAVNEPDQSYIVMEYVTGGTLERHCIFDALLPVERVVTLVFKVGLALAYAQQQGVIHCDIKPGNLLLAGDTEPKISDFGAAHNLAAEHTYLSGIGSPTYMSPEQVEDKRLNHQTDIYSLGVVLYHLLTGKRPFQGSTRESLLYQIVHLEPLPPSLHRPEIPPGLDAIVMRALAKSREERYLEWRDFARDLERLFEHLSVPDQDLSDAEKFSTLRLLPFFSGFGDVEIWETLRISHWHRMPAGTTVVREGDEDDGFFILAAGEAFVNRAGVALDTLMRGHCFGKILYFEAGNARRTTSILATTSVVLMEIKASALARASPACQVQYYQSFLRILMKRIERFEQRLVAGTSAEQDPDATVDEHCSG